MKPAPHWGHGIIDCCYRDLLEQSCEFSKFRCASWLTLPANWQSAEHSKHGIFEFCRPPSSYYTTRKLVTERDLVRYKKSTYNVGQAGWIVIAIGTNIVRFALGRSSANSLEVAQRAQHWGRLQFTVWHDQWQLTLFAVQHLFLTGVAQVHHVVTLATLCKFTLFIGEVVGS